MKKFFYVLLLFFCGSCLFGCDQNEQDTETTKQAIGTSNVINIYYPEDGEVVVDTEGYQLIQPDIVSASVEEIMSVVAEKLEEHIVYHTYMLDGDNNVSLDFNLQGELDKEYYLLVKAAVSSTLFQLDDINSVKVRLFDEAGSVISEELFLRNSFYYYDVVGDDYRNSKEVNVYLPSSEGTKIVKKNITIHLEPNVTAMENAIKYMAEQGAIPEKTKVNSLIVNGNICYVDLSSDFTEEVSGVNSEVVLYCLVNSLTSFSDISKVQITIDGEKVSMYRGVVNIESPLEFNNEILSNISGGK